MGLFRDAPLGIESPGIRKVARRLYLWNGQFMYNTAAVGVRLYAIPDEDVYPLERRTGRIELAAVFVVFALLAGVLAHALSIWCIPVALLALLFATPTLVGRSVGERYPMVTDSAAVKAVRRRIALDHPPSAAALALMVLNLPATLPAFSGTSAWMKITLAVCLFLVDGVRLLVGWIERRALREESLAS